MRKACHRAPISLPVDHDRTVAVHARRQAAHGSEALTDCLVELLLRLPGRFALDLGNDASVTRVRLRRQRRL